MVDFIICLGAIFIFTIGIFEYVRTKGSKKDPSVDGLNKFKPYKTSNSSNVTDLSTLESLEITGSLPTNITGLNPNHFD